MKIFLISGTNGFIGGTLLRSLRKMGEAVYPIPREYLYQPEKLYDLVNKVCPTHIIHCASYGNMYNQRDEHQAVMANVNATFNLLNATKNNEYESFSYFSSSSVYGISDKPMKEDDKTEGTTMYAITKIAGEYLCKYFIRNYSKPIVIIRPFSVYGPGEADYRFIPMVVRAVRNNTSLKLASGMHDWIYIEDFINGLLLILENIKYTSGQIINIGTGIQHDNYEIVNMICRFRKKTIENMENIEYVDMLRSYDSTSWVADNGKLLSLGWKQKFSLSEGLKACWDSYR